MPELSRLLDQLRNAALARMGNAPREDCASPVSADQSNASSSSNLLLQAMQVSADAGRKTAADDAALSEAAEREAQERHLAALARQLIADEQAAAAAAQARAVSEQRAQAEADARERASVEQRTAAAARYRTAADETARLTALERTAAEQFLAKLARETIAAQTAATHAAQARAAAEHVASAQAAEHLRLQKEQQKQILDKNYAERAATGQERERSEAAAEVAARERAGADAEVEARTRTLQRQQRRQTRLAAEAAASQTPEIRQSTAPQPAPAVAASPPLRDPQRHHRSRLAIAAMIAAGIFGLGYWTGLPDPGTPKATPAINTEMPTSLQLRLERNVDALGKRLQDAGAFDVPNPVAPLNR